MLGKLQAVLFHSIVGLIEFHGVRLADLANENVLLRLRPGRRTFFPLLEREHRQDIVRLGKEPLLADVTCDREWHEASNRPNETKCKD